MVPTHNSAGVEHVALQGKTPWVAPAAAIEELEGYWNTANKINHSVLPYNHRDDEGNEIPPPTRPAPPEMGQGFVQGMQIARGEIDMTSGQYGAAVGQPDNSRTGKAILERVQQADTNTFHFQDNLRNFTCS